MFARLSGKEEEEEKEKLVLKFQADSTYAMPWQLDRHVNMMFRSPCRAMCLRWLAGWRFSEGVLVMIKHNHCSQKHVCEGGQAPPTPVSVNLPQAVTLM